MKKWSFVALLLVGATILGATVLRDPIAVAATPFQNVIVKNTADEPVPVKQQGTSQVTVANTPLSVDAGYETQLLIDQTVVDDDRVTIPVAAYKTIHVDFRLMNGGCAGSGASLLIVEATRFLSRGFIGADDACAGGFTGETIEMPGRSLTFIVHAPVGDTWRVVVFGRAN